MFDTPLVERMSHIPPASPFIFWLPVLAALTLWVGLQEISVLGMVGLFLAGWLAWTLVEWLLHKYIFHYCGPKPWQRRFYFVAHGMHHDYPADAERLVMPLGISVPTGLVFFLLMASIWAVPVASMLFVGFGSGYLFYDGVHYFTHHMKSRTRVGKFLKKHHMVHHYTGVDGLYGVSTPLWDLIFGTMEDRRAKKSRLAAPAE
jgi:dihydroceramide fatty acyl 2-hydroxylase